MTTANDPHIDDCDTPSEASSRFRISKEGIESEHRVPGEHTPGLLSSVVIMICCVMAVAAPAVTLKFVADNMGQTSIALIVLVQEAVILAAAIIAKVRRRN